MAERVWLKNLLDPETGLQIYGPEGEVIMVPRTPEEIEVALRDEAEYNARKGPAVKKALEDSEAFRKALKQKFAEVVMLHKADLTDIQISEVLDRAKTIDDSYGEYALMLGKVDHKKSIIGSIKRMASLPASKDPVKQAMIDFVEANYK
jgi:hypothetical protein